MNTVKKFEIRHLLNIHQSNIKKLSTWLESAYRQSPRIELLMKSNKSIFYKPFDNNVDQFNNRAQNLKKSKYTVGFSM